MIWFMYILKLSSQQVEWTSMVLLGAFLQREQQGQNESSRKMWMLLGEWSHWRATTGSETERQVYALGWGWGHPRWDWTSVSPDPGPSIRDHCDWVMRTVSERHSAKCPPSTELVKKQEAFQGLGTRKRHGLCHWLPRFQVYWFWPLRRLKLKKLLIHSILVKNGKQCLTLYDLNISKLAYFSKLSKKVSRPFFFNCFVY